MASYSVEIMHSLGRASAQVVTPREIGTGNESGLAVQNTSSKKVQKVSLVKLAPLETASKTSPLSPNTLARLVEEQAKSHQAIEALQQRIQATSPKSLASGVRKELEESAIKQRNYLKQIIGTPALSSGTTASQTGAGSAMLDTSNDVMRSLPLAKKLFPVGSDFDEDAIVDKEPGTESERWTHNRTDSNRKAKKSDTDNDTGVESDTGSDPGGEICGFETPLAKASKWDFSPIKKLRLGGDVKGSGDELLLYLEMIEKKALAIKSLIEQAKLDTVLNIRRQIEAEFNGLPLEEIPAKCHQRIDRAIQKYLKLELEKIRSEYERKETEKEASGTHGESLSSASANGGELARENENLREKIGSLEMSVSRVDMLYLMQKKENEYLTEKVTKLERQLSNEKLKYENDLDNFKHDYEESTTKSSDFTRDEHNTKYGTQTVEFSSSLSKKKAFRSKSETANENPGLASLSRKLELKEKQVEALRVAGEADQTTIRCLENKVNSLEVELNVSRQEINELLDEIRELNHKSERQEKKLQEREAQLEEVYDERKLLRETLIMSEHEISLLENKLGTENNEAWRESKKEILEDLRKLEKHIKVIHKEKRKLENKYLAFKIENEHLSDSLNSFSKTKDILTPLGSCNVTRQPSTLSSHSSSLSSSLAGSDIEEDEDVRHVSRGRRRKRSAQDQKDKKFAEAVARKLMFAQQVLKDQNCNFSSFENSGEDLINEADQLVKRVDSLQAEKRAIKLELESIRSTQPENVMC